MLNGTAQMRKEGKRGKGADEGMDKGVHEAGHVEEEDD